MKQLLSLAAEQPGRSGRRSSRARKLGLLTALAALLPTGHAFAAKTDESFSRAQSTLEVVTRSITDVEATIASARVEERSPEARIADGELVLRGKDYARAATVFNEVIEKYPTHQTAVPDASWLLGETYYEAHEYLSAKRAYKRIVDRSSEPRFAAYQARALGRLIDIALRTREYAGLDEIFSHINSLPPASVDDGLSYARGKGLFVKKDFPSARAALQAVSPKSALYHQARYLLGVIALKEAPAAPAGSKDKPAAPSPARFASALDAFRQVTQLAADTPEHKQVVDLAWMAIGRIGYESEQFLEAADAYDHVDRSSPEFGAMLYEIAWVYVRLGDADRAQRALEVLSIAEPNSTFIADGSLLRADLMLRAGQFDKALALYQSVRSEFDPIRDRVETFLGSTSDAAVYYDRLSREALDSSDASALPAVAIDWAREAENGPAAFALIDDVAQCRSLLKQSTTLVERLTALLSAPNRIRAFPELKAGAEKTLSLLNTLAQARFGLAATLDSIEAENVSGDAARVRDERRALAKRVQGLPVTGDDFGQREADAQRQWNTVSQNLQQLTLEVDSLHAIVNGLRRSLKEAPSRGVVRDGATVRQFEADIATAEHELAGHRAQMAELRKLVERGRLQVGFGDQRFVDDAEARAAFRRALLDEAKLAAAGSLGRDAVAFGQQIQSLLALFDAQDQKLEAILGELDERVAKRVVEVKAMVDAEGVKIAQYSTQLETLDSEARLVVGQVAMKNFGIVRDKLRNIVLRADVGITEEAWEVREEQMTRVRNLQVERARSEQQLGEELREVLDDMGDGDKGSSGGAK